MWCPKCKNEYVEGFTHCADCDCDLVESLDMTEDFEYEIKNNFLSREESKKILKQKMLIEAEENLSSDDISDEDLEENVLDEIAEATKKIAPAHAYVSKSTKKEDVKSTAYTFLIVSIAGFILLGLFLAGVLPIYVASYMKVIISIVMGAMFLIFFIIGVRSFRDIKKLENEADTEKELYQEVTDWFKENYSAEKIDAQADTSVGKEQLYFSRYEVMSELITEKYDSLEDSFLDHIIEELYSDIFSE